MPPLDSIILKEKIPIKNLTLILDEDDNVMDCIKCGMLTHNIKECNVTAVSGNLKTGLINYMDRHEFKSEEIKDRQISKASGNFKVNSENLFGKLNIFIDGRRPLSATIVKATASQDFELTLCFIE